MGNTAADRCDSTLEDGNGWDVNLPEPPPYEGVVGSTTGLAGNGYHPPRTAVPAASSCASLDTSVFEQTQHWRASPLDFSFQRYIFIPYHQSYYPPLRREIHSAAGGKIPQVITLGGYHHELYHRAILVIVLIAMACNHSNRTSGSVHALARLCPDGYVESTPGGSNTPPLAWRARQPGHDASRW